VSGGPSATQSAPWEDRAFGDGLFVEQIPTSCWFTNVRTCMSPSDSARVKALVVARTGRRCEVCGTGAEPSQGLWLPANERWSYNDATRVQTLRRLVCLCTRCHRATHVGFAEITGHRTQAHAHLRAVNRRIVVDTDAHFAMAARVWRARSGWTGGWTWASSPPPGWSPPPPRPPPPGVPSPPAPSTDHP